MCSTWLTLADELRTISIGFDKRQLLNVQSILQYNM
jgi:hypothetical protein